jgi:hypothetical protein
LIIPGTGKSQEKDNIEFSVFSTYNTQGKYSTQFGNVSYTNNLKISGTDFGFTIDYKRLVNSKTYLKLGLGYMVFAVDKIYNETGTGNNITTSDARPINFPSNAFLLYSTTKYHYNNLLYHIGIERQFSTSGAVFLLVGVDYIHANSLNQKYYIPKIQDNYNTSNHGNFGNFFNLNLGVCKRFGNFSFSPALVLPVYTNWNQDVVFRENPNNTVSSWANGIGLMLSVSYR